MEVSGQLHAPVTLHPGKDPSPGTHWIGGWVDAIAGVDAGTCRYSVLK